MGRSVLLFLLLNLLTTLVSSSRMNVSNTAPSLNNVERTGNTVSRNLNNVGKNSRDPINHRNHVNQFQDTERLKTPKTVPEKPTRKKPNIIFILTDDQDVELGSLNYMPKTLKYVRTAGASFPNAFTTTPMCCPSRSSMLTGLYVHNHNTYSNNDNCSGQAWRSKYEENTFGKLLQDAGYHTGYFGKYLNEYPGTYIPTGWTEWMGLVKNTRFYNYSLNHNGSIIKHRDEYPTDYLTHVITKNSLQFFERSKKFHPDVPVAMVLSMPAPHGPEDSAPQYQHLFTNVKSHRTPSWNFAPNPDKQWLLEYTDKMSSLQKEFTDVLHTKRLQTLQSVDDAVEKVHDMLYNLKELDNTYIFYSSDHGYHLGQFGLVKGKAMPYEFDIRVPFLVRGPNVPKNVTMSNIVLNLDIAPTFLDIAGISSHVNMDGSSIMKVFDNGRDNLGSVRKRNVLWRDTFLVERGKLTAKKLRLVDEIEAKVNNLTMSRSKKMERECEKPEYQPPCKPNQKWKCLRNKMNKLRFFKCRSGENPPIWPVPVASKPNCKCSLSPREKKLQLSFLKSNVNQPEKIQPTFIENGIKKVKTRSPYHNGLINIHNLSSDQWETTTEDHYNLTSQWSLVEGDLPPISVPCRVRANGKAECRPLVYTDHNLWTKQKTLLDRIIKGYDNRLSKLQKIRNHLLEHEPSPSSPPSSFLVSTRNYQRNYLDTYNNKTKDFEYEEIRFDDDDDGGYYGDVTDCICDGDEKGGDDDHDEDDDDDPDNNTKPLRRPAQYDKKSPWFVRRRRRLENSTRNKKTFKKSYKLKAYGKGSSLMMLASSRKHLKDCTVFNNCSEADMTTINNLHWNLNNPARHDPACYVQGMECFRMDNDHWRVKPFWERGPFCSCSNANNNTYWCLRTINNTHNFLYCEFITGFISYYDLNRDPYQLKNVVLELSYDVLHQLHRKLDLMKDCKGFECNFPPSEDDHWFKKRKLNRKYLSNKYLKHKKRHYKSQRSFFK